MNAPRAGAGALPWVFSNHGLRHSGGIERYLLTLVRGLHEQGVRPTVIAKTIDRSIEEAGWVDATAVSMFGVPGKLRDLWFDRRLRALKKRHGWFPLIALNQTAAADIAPRLTLFGECGVRLKARHATGKDVPCRLRVERIPTDGGPMVCVDLERVEMPQEAGFGTAHSPFARSA